MPGNLPGIIGPGATSYPLWEFFVAAEVRVSQGVSDHGRFCASNNYALLKV